jgi:hypothetical protein
MAVAQPPGVSAVRNLNDGRRLPSARLHARKA